MNRFQNKLLSVIMTVLLLVSVLYVGREMASYVTSRSVNVKEEKRCVVIDAGHGGIEYRPKKGGKNTDINMVRICLMTVCGKMQVNVGKCGTNAVLKWTCIWQVVVLE